MPDKKSRVKYLVMGIPAVLLFFVALTHIHFAVTDRLAAREGGSFGMYSVAQRTYVRAFVVDEQGAKGINPAAYDDIAASKVVHWPSVSNLTSFAKALACNPILNASFPNINKVRIEYWHGHYDGQGMDIKKKDFAEATCE